MGKPAHSFKLIFQLAIEQKNMLPITSVNGRVVVAPPQLPVSACIEGLRVLSRHDSADGTVKWLFDVGAGDVIETVFIPESDRGTLCVSSQARVLPVSRLQVSSSK